MYLLESKWSAGFLLSRRSNDRFLNLQNPSAVRISFQRTATRSAILVKMHDHCFDYVSDSDKLLSNSCSEDEVRMRSFFSGCDFEGDCRDMKDRLARRLRHLEEHCRALEMHEGLDTIYESSPGDSVNLDCMDVASLALQVQANMRPCEGRAIQEHERHLIYVPARVSRIIPLLHVCLAGAAPPLTDQFWRHTLIMRSPAGSSRFSPWTGLTL